MISEKSKKEYSPQSEKKINSNSKHCSLEVCNLPKTEQTIQNHSSSFQESFEAKVMHPSEPPSPTRALKHVKSHKGSLLSRESYKNAQDKHVQSLKFFAERASKKIGQKETDEKKSPMRKRLESTHGMLSQIYKNLASPLGTTLKQQKDGQDQRPNKQKQPVLQENFEEKSNFTLHSSISPDQSRVSQPAVIQNQKLKPKKIIPKMNWQDPENFESKESPNSQISQKPRRKFTSPLAIIVGKGKEFRKENQLPNKVSQLQSASPPASPRRHKATFGPANQQSGCPNQPFSPREKKQLCQSKKIITNPYIGPNAGNMQISQQGSVTSLAQFQGKIQRSNSFVLCKTPSLPSFLSVKNSDLEIFSQNENDLSIDIEFQKEPQINDFILLQKIGEGSFGVVFVAVHKRTRMLLGLKKIKKMDLLQSKIKEQFVREIKLQFYLNHQNIVKLYGVFDDQEYIYLILEYMEEGNLYNQLTRRKTLPEKEVAQKMHGILEAIDHMHSLSIMHRDIKPQNIVMNYGVCKLCDLGSAAECKDRRYTLCGTMDYFSPELVEGENYQFSLDIWSLGVLTYELLMGKSPFYRRSRKETINLIKQCDLISINKTGLSEEADSFIMKMLVKNPELRISAQDALKHEFILKYNKRQ